MERDDGRCPAVDRALRALLASHPPEGATVALAGFLGTQRLNDPLPLTLAAGGSARMTWHSMEKPDAIVLDPQALLLQGGRARWAVAQ